MKSREILFDREITGIEDCVTQFGPARSFEGRILTASELGDSEILIVRSVTTVNGDLLQGSRIKLVCSATAGIDHVDTNYLKNAGIDFFSTRGCNSEAVVEYTISTILLYAHSRGLSLSDLTIGIIGFGNIGKRLAVVLKRLGISFLANDPPLKEGELTDKSFFSDIEEIIACDVVTLHVPLVREGPFPTENLITLSLLKKMKKNTLVINTSRGGVINESDLLDFLSEGGDLYVILDCWCGEPKIDASLASLVWKASPHIAGSSIKSRQKSVSALSRKLSNYLGVPKDTHREVTGLKEDIKVTVQPARCLVDLLDELVPINSSSLEMKTLKNISSRVDVGKKFDLIRKTFGNRKDFSFYWVTPTSPEKELMIKIGFRVDALDL